MSKKCCVCGKIITNSYDLCNKCLSEYGKDRSEWPEWLIFLVADTQREKYRKVVVSRYEIHFSDLGLDVADGPEISSHY